MSLYYDWYKIRCFTGAFNRWLCCNTFRSTRLGHYEKIDHKSREHPNFTFLQQLNNIIPFKTLMKRCLTLKIGTEKSIFIFLDKWASLFGATVAIDCTKAYEKPNPFHLLSFLLFAQNLQVGQCGLKILDTELITILLVVCIELMVLLLLVVPDGTFGFSLIEFHPDFTVFEKKCASRNRTHSKHNRACLLVLLIRIT